MDIKDCQISISIKGAMFFEKQNGKIIIKDILDYTYKKEILKNVYISKNNEDLVSLNNFGLDTVNIIKNYQLWQYLKLLC